MATEYEKLKFKAGYLLKKSIRNGSLVRPCTCELCGDTPPKQRYVTDNDKFGYRSGIQAHHWNGYHNPLDVWWICQPCNIKLMGEENHAGLVTKEEASKFCTNSKKQTNPH